MKYSLFQNLKYMYKRAFDYLPKMKYWILLYIVCSILAPIVTTLVPTVVVHLIDNSADTKNFLLTITASSALLIVVSVLKNHYFEQLYWYQILVRSRQFIAKEFNKQMENDYANIESYDKQLLLQKASTSTSGNYVGVELFYKSFPDVIINLVGLIVYSLFISSLNFWILLIFLVMTTMNLALSKLARDYEQDNKEIYNRYDRKIDYLYEEAISDKNGKDVRLYKMEQWFIQNFKSLLKLRTSWNIKINTRYFLPQLSDQILLCIRDFVAYGILVSMVVNQQMTPTTFTFYLGIIGGFSAWLNQFVTSYTNLKRANLGVNDYREYEDITNVFNHSEGIDIHSLKQPLTIEFKDVSFHYPGSEKNIINHLDLTIEAGEKIALVGVNGAGKTTLVKLLSGLYYPSGGEIRINGFPIQEFNINEYYQLIGTVFQNVEVFSFTIASNVSGCMEEKIDYERLWKCLELAGLKDKIETLPKKEQTYLTRIIDDEGVQLSGGQMQKLMLARALYKNAPIMILDEPTAALDPIAEAELYERYYNLTKEKTSIFISHRLSSTKFCERILYLEQGDIKEDGTHAELISLGGEYANMYEMQSHYYKEEGEQLNERIYE